MQNNAKSTSGVGKTLLIAVKLLVICALVAVLVAAVNLVTADKIVLNEKNSTAQSLSVIYEPDGLAFTVDENGDYAVTDADGNPTGTLENITPEEPLADIDEVYAITLEDGKTFGYCVKTTPMGFKDEVTLLVAVDPTCAVKAVSVISLSETAGIGDQVTSEDFRGQFVGKMPGFSENHLSDYIISGATRTSEPVTVAIDTALRQIESLNKGEEQAS